MPAAFKPVRHGEVFESPPLPNFGELSKAPRPLEPPAFSPVPDAGTPIAIKYLTSGVAAESVSRPRRGGARNSASRKSHALTAAQVGNLMAATDHAEAIGKPLNRMITVHWQAAGLPLEDMVRATGHFLDLVGKFLSRQGHPSTWIWTHENAGGKEKGGHAHLLLHVTPQLVPAFTKAQRGWLRRVTHQPYRARVIHSKPVGGRLGVETSNPELHTINLEAALEYVLKGASPEAAAQFGLTRLEAGGITIGKRCATSQNIGKAARARWQQAKAKNQ